MNQFVWREFNTANKYFQTKPQHWIIQKYKQFKKSIAKLIYWTVSQIDNDCLFNAWIGLDNFGLGIWLELESHRVWKLLNKEINQNY